ncbi:hypothetical protein ACFWI5_13625, partial [Streptomyces sp. NPDC127064]|uniref:hypothetical protein n=1 Tax=Streptomyces sp. NPDC127064 TaxID=3347124 RepID=UPI0036656403
MDGGLTRSALLMQAQADLLRRPVGVSAAVSHLLGGEQGSDGGVRNAGRRGWSRPSGGAVLRL